MIATNRRNSARASDPKAPPSGLAAVPPHSIVTLPTSAIYGGKPVQWANGVLYVDGKPARRASR